MSDGRRYVLFPMGDRHYALDAERVRELLMPAELHAFPHTTPSLEGVLLRNGSVIPVCNLGGVGEGNKRSFYVVAECQYAGRQESVAIPVSGDCELVEGERLPTPAEVTFVAGLLRTEGRTVPLLDLDRVMAHCIQPVTDVAREAKP